MLLHHTDSGSGHPVVLIHGFCESLTIWEGLIPSLNKSNRIIAIDLPGFGKSEIPTDQITIENIAEKVNSFLVEKGIEQCTMIGHSLGGYVTLAYAEAYPNKLKGMGLFHSSAFADSEEKKANRNKTMEFIKKRGLDLFINSFVPSLFESSNHPSIPIVSDIAKKTPLDTVLRYTEAMRDRKDRTKALRKFEAPVLIIAGEHDNAVPAEISKQMSTIPANCHYYMLEVAHMGMYETPKKCSEILKVFLEHSK